MCQHFLILPYHKECFWKRNESNYEYDQEIEHIIHDNKDTLNQRRYLINESHVIQALQPHHQNENTFDHSYVWSSKLIKEINQRDWIQDDDQAVYLTPESEECLQAKTFGLHHEHKHVEYVEYSTAADTNVRDGSQSVVFRFLDNN